MRKGNSKSTETGGLRIVDPSSHTRRRLLCGTARVSGHLGELLQGCFNTPLGPIRALVTLPCDPLNSKVSVEITEAAQVRTEPAGLIKAAKAARRALDYGGRPKAGAIVRIASNIEHGAGNGSSTCDTAATFIAVADAIGLRLSREEVAILTVETETASDPTMFDPGQVRLFAQRIGVTLELFEGELPAFEVLGITDGDPIDTVKHRAAQYPRALIPQCDLLRDGLRAALLRSDARAVAQIGTSSAMLNQLYLPKPGFDTWMELAERYGALGLVVSHSGSSVGFLFDAGDAERSVRIHELIAELAYMKVEPSVRYVVGGARKAA